jgi:hypothetical protein
MTFPDTSLERTGVDPDVTAMIHGADAEQAHGGPDSDKATSEGAAAPIAERVYAPASERVPVAAVPGHRDMVEHTDEHTPERVAAGLSSEPSFTRVDRPSTASETQQPSQPAAPEYAPRGGGYQGTSATPGNSGNQGTSGSQGAPAYPGAPGYSGAPGYGDVPGYPDAAGYQGAPSGQGNSGYQGTSAYQGAAGYQAYPASPEPSNSMRRPGLFLGLSVSWLTVLGAGVGVWLFRRWRRERNKPINRIRRRARLAASRIGDRMPTSRDEAVQPALGVSAALASSLFVFWQQAQSRRGDVVKEANRQSEKATRRADKAARHAAEAIADVDWQKQLTQLKKRWSPRRLELEKVSISRH